jgi:hypothetical protein
MVQLRKEFLSRKKVRRNDTTFLWKKWKKTINTRLAKLEIGIETPKIDEIPPKTKKVGFGSSISTISDKVLQT